MPTEENPSGNEIEPLEHPLVAASKKENLPILRNQALHRYLQEISQYELLSREEIDELAVRFRETGDPEAAYRLVSANLRLVVKVAMDFQKHWMQNFMDLIQEGNVGLVHPNADWRLPVRPRAKSYRLSATMLTRVGSYKGLAAKPLFFEGLRPTAPFISETPVYHDPKGSASHSIPLHKIRISKLNLSQFGVVPQVDVSTIARNTGYVSLCILTRETKMLGIETDNTTISVNFRLRFPMPM